jgi:uncharacterized protein YbjQ (UPF0145 family)
MADDDRSWRPDRLCRALLADRSPAPPFVEARLSAVAAGKTPWIATMSAAELGLARGKGIRPLATVSGTCWYHYGYSWTHGHAEGWHQALARLQQEARALGANAVVDVKMRKIDLAIGDSMDFTLVGTAVRIDGGPAGEHPIVATVPALEFVRLLEADIVPVGIAIGAQYDYLSSNIFFCAPGTQGTGLLWPMQAGALSSSVSFSFSAAGNVQGSGRPFTSMPLPELSQFWEGIRRDALMELRHDARHQGSGGLCHVNASEHASRATLARRHAAATALCHCAVASARKIRSVDREMR